MIIKSFNVNEIRSQLTLGGARPALFQVQFSNPVSAAADLKVPFMVRATNIPSSTLGQVIVPYFGRQVKIAGDRTFVEWNTTVINDEDFLVRDSIEEWMQNINSHQGNVRGFGSSAPSSYKGQATVTQFSKTGVPVRVYKFDGLWPVNVSEIPLDWETTDTFEQFDITWAYDYWTVDGGITGDAGGS